MKIAIFADTFYPYLGGREDSIALAARALGRRGHEVHVYVPYINGEEISLGQNVFIHRLPAFSLPVSIPTRLAFPGFRGWRTLREKRPDIVHTHTFFSLGLGSIIASRWFGVPLIGTNHSIVSEFARYSPIAPKLISRLGSRYDAWFYNRGEMLTAPSSVVVNEMARHGFIRPARIISNPIDTEIFSLPQVDKEELKKDFGLAGRPVISFAGRFSIEKRGEVILRALALVRNKIPDVVLALAGAGIEEAHWRELINDLGLGSNVVFTGVLSKPDLAKLFQASDLFVIASPAETQSMVTLQAMACGLPVVGVNARALPDYVADGETGYLVDADDHVAMAERLIELLENSDLRQSFGLAGRRVAEKYSAEAVGREWEETYEKVINNYKNKFSS